MPPPEATPAPPTPLHRNRDFRNLWIGQAFSELGSSASALAYTLLVLALTGSPIQAGLVGSFALAARTVLGLPAGALVDRWNRKTVMLACEVVRVVALGALAAAILAGKASVPLILVIATIESAAAVLFGPAQTAALRHIVPTEQLGVASARNEARSYAAQLAGPPMGGALFSVTRAAPFLADAISYLISLISIARIKRPLQEERTQEHEPIRSSIWQGMRFLWNEPFLRATLYLGALLNGAFTGVMFVLVVVLEQRGVPAAGIGAAQSAILVGGFVGSLIAPWLQPRVRTPVLIVTICWLATGLVAASAFVPGTYTVAVLLALVIVAAPSINAGLFGYQIAITPDAMQGRVDSAGNLVAQALSPFAPLVGGLVVSRWGGGWAMGVFAAMLGIAAVIASTSRGIRSMRPLEDLAVERDKVRVADVDGTG